MNAKLLFAVLLMLALTCPSIINKSARIKGGTTIGKITKQRGCIVTLRFDTGAEHELLVEEVEVIK